MNEYISLIKAKALTKIELVDIIDDKDAAKFLINIYIYYLKNNYKLSFSFLENINITICNVEGIKKTNGIINKLYEIKKLIDKHPNKKDITKFYTIFENDIINKIACCSSKNNYDYMHLVIFDIQNKNYLSNTIKTNPQYVNVFNDKHIFLEVFDKFYECLSKNKDYSYWLYVLTEFSNCLMIRVLENDLKACKDKLNGFDSQLINYIETLFLKITKSKMTQSNIETLNKHYDITSDSFNFKHDIITIDDASTLDMDDALSVVKIDNYYELKVYIINAALVIEKNSKLDIEAYKKAETIWLSTGMKPIFPKELVYNNLSLNKKGLKPVIVYTFDIYENGEVTNFRIDKEWIKVSNNFSYDRVNHILKKGDERKLNILYLNEVANILKTQTLAKLPYRLSEDEILEETNRSYKPYKNKTQSEKIIEECMLLVGRELARFASLQGYPFLYRVMKDSFNEKTLIIEKTRKKLSENMENEEHYLRVLTNAFKLLPPANYSYINCGHIGLNTKYQCHATSPGRRYPDIITQRILEDFYFTNNGDYIKWMEYLKEASEYMNKRIKLNNQYQAEYEKIKHLIHN